ncbi:MAG: M24 family metallopeptidase [Nanobdellota archaeon]
MRIATFQKELRKSKISCAIISGFSQDPNIEYFLGKGRDSCFLFIPQKGNCTLLAPEMNVPYLKKESTLNVKGITHPIEKNIANLVKRKKSVGVNKQEMVVSEFEAIKKGLNKKTFYDVSSQLKKTRAVKNKKEIAILSKACKITDNIIQETLSKLKEFETEVQVKNFLIKRTIDFGCDTSFEPLVASGKNTSYVHYEKSNAKIKKGFFYIDFGVDYKGYKSDMTRTIYLGNPNKKEKEIYNLLLKTQKETIAMAAPGVKCSTLDKFVRKSLGKVQENFTHALGHGVGIEVHETPTISSGSETTLKEGMTITIEPGIYFPGKYGMRIEDTLVITKTGARVLTKTNKDYI